MRPWNLSERRHRPASPATTPCAGTAALRQLNAIAMQELSAELFGAELPQAENGAEQHTDDISAALSERIAAEIDSLRSQCSHLTIVTNEVFSGGKEYEGETLTYLRLLAMLNRKLAAGADLVVEVVCGLPDILKGAQTQ